MQPASPLTQWGGSEWIIDPTNPNQIDDGAGNVNSLFLCTP